MGKKKLIVIILSICLIVSVFFVTGKITDNNLNETLTFQLNDMIPGDTQTYNFTIKNYISDNITETKMNYSLRVLKSTNIPVNIYLYKNNVQTNILDNNLVSSNNILDVTTKITDSYQLIIYWDANETYESYSGQTDYIDIVIESVQVIE
ncbi:MAG: hypothetical protein Q4G04_03605 [bacterium]|nr:hypothetical protein [bacterium]